MLIVETEKNMLIDMSHEYNIYNASRKNIILYFRQQCSQ